MRSEKPICASPRLSEVSPNVVCGHATQQCGLGQNHGGHLYTSICLGKGKEILYSQVSIRYNHPSQGKQLTTKALIFLSKKSIRAM